MKLMQGKIIMMAPVNAYDDLHRKMKACPMSPWSTLRISVNNDQE